MKQSITQEKLLKILLSPHQTEKTSRTAGQYVFKVKKTANKFDIKKAVEQFFQVNVKSVNVACVKGEVATKMGRAVGRMSSWKKAYVVLQDGQEINLN